MNKLLEQVNNNSTVGSIKDLVFPVSKTFDFSDRKEVVFINTGDVLEGKFLHDNYSPVKKLPGQAKKSIEKGDIVFSEIRPKNKHFALVDFDSKDYVVSTKLIVLKVKEAVDPRYAYIVLTADQNLREFQNIAESRSGTFPQITFESIADYEINIPDLPTQKKIAEILGSYDKKIENNNKIIINLETLAQTIFNEWFVRNSTDGNQRIATLGEVIELAYGKALKDESRKNGSVVVVGSSGIVGNHNEKLVAGPGIVVGRKGVAGSVIWIDGDFYPIDTTFYVKTKLPLIFCYYLLRRVNFISGDSAVPGLNRDDAYRTEISLPSPKRMEEFQLIAKPIFLQRHILKKQNQELKIMRDILLSKLMNGKIKA